MQFILLCAFILGTIIGSFLNVVVLRYGTKKLSGRSMCFSCGKALSWFELVPVLSFFAQSGRCRGCKAGISWQYPVVELLTGLVFMLVFWKESSLLFSSSFSLLTTNYLLLTLSIWSLLIAIAVYDIRHKIIPNALVYSAALLSLVFLLVTSTFELKASSFLRDLVAGPLLALPFALVWFFSKGRAMGLGDAKLMLFFPWLVGLSGGVSAVLLGFWAGASIAIVGIILKAVASIPDPSAQTKRRRFLLPDLKAGLKDLTMKTELPLAPFLILGLFIVYLFGIDVTGLSLLLQSGNNF